MSFRQLNLASRPFLNARPVVRLAAVLWVAGGLLLLANLILYGRALRVGTERRAELARLEEQLAVTRQESAELAAAPELDGLEQYNERVAWLNGLIDQRTFPWSRLFERLAEVLPEEVRLDRLTPATGGTATPEGGVEGLVRLTLSGEARSDEALYAFVDALYADPAFQDPVLGREVLAPGAVRFNLQVRCDPAVLRRAPPATGEEEGESS